MMNKDEIIKLLNRPDPVEAVYDRMTTICLETIGATYAHVCVMMDYGKDIRKEDVPKFLHDVLEMMKLLDDRRKKCSNTNSK